MSIVVNTNLASLNAQRQLQANNNQLAQSLQRLSSGLRINSAKDDAAGLAVSESLKVNIRGAGQGVRNANDGISMAQTAEGALGEIANNLQRIREVAVQSANGSVSDTNRGQLQKEVNQLTQEISRIVQTTEFNGTHLLSGSSTLTFQVGASGSATNQISIATTDLTATTGNPAAYAAAQNVVAMANFGVDSGNAIYSAANFGVSATPGATLTSTGSVSSTSAHFVFASSDAISAAAVATYNAMESVYNAGGGLAGGVTKAQVIAAGQSAAAAYQGGTSVLNSYNSNLAGGATINISSQGNASAALASLDADIAQISNLRATFGAVQNRFDAVVANMQNYIENLSAASSRITDTDFSQETSLLTRGQILQQAGTAILAQANTLPQAALSLLR